MAINYNAAIPLNMFLQKRAGSISLTTQQNIDQLIKSIFANNEQGFTRTLDDLTILYQDAVGTIPVTGAGQPVGLMLDKSKSIPYSRRNLFTYSEEFNNSAWSKTNASVSTNSVTAPDGTQTADKLVERATTSEHFLGSPAYTAIASAHTLSIYAKVGERDTFFYDFKSNDASQGRVLFNLSGNTATVAFGTAASAAITDVGNGWKRCVFTATLAAGTNTAKLGLHTTSINYSGDGSSGIYLWGIQLEVGITATPYQKVESNYGGWVAGNHAYQTTSAARPLFKTLPNRIEYDKVDDKLITILPAQLTGCTVIRSVPNVGTQILTNQTIPTPYNDSTDHCGLIVINRALTTAETAQITQLFNKAAGV